MLKDMLTLPEAAELLGVGEETIRRLCRRHQLAFYDIPGCATYRFLPADIERFAAAHRIECKSVDNTTVSEEFAQ